MRATTMLRACLAAGAAMAIAPGAAGAATVITDPAGDANGLANLGFEQATAPASDGPRDLTGVTLAREGDDLVVGFRVSAPIDPVGLQTLYSLRTTVGTCRITLAGSAGTLPGDAPHGPGGVLDMGNCAPEGFTSIEGGYSAALDGSTLTVRYPLARLGQHVPVTTGSVLTFTRADTRIGVYLVGNDTQSCSPPSDPCLPILTGPSKAEVGPLLDATATGSNFTIPPPAQG